MTHSRLSALGLVLAVFLCFQTARAQQSDPPNNDQKAAEEALREKAFKLLDSLSDQLSSLQSAENRARMGSNIAESLWSRDEKRARALFAMVETDINSGLLDAGEDRNAQRTFIVFIKLRDDTIDRIVRHDPELALTFLKRTQPLPTMERNPGIADHEHELELRLARRIAAQNPEIAVTLAGRSLARGFSDDLLPLLLRLSRKDQQQATALYKEIVARLRDTDLTEGWYQGQFAATLARTFTPPLADDSTYRELLEIMVSKALAFGCENSAETAKDTRYFCTHVGSVLPLMEQFSIPQAARLKRWARTQEFMNRLRPDLTRGYYELNDLIENGSTDELLALLPKYPELESEIRMRAAMKAVASGEFDRAQKIVSEYSGETNLKQLMENHIKTSYVPAEKVEERLAEIQKNVRQLPLSRQIEVLVSLAGEAAPQNPKLAVRVLSQSEAMVETMPASEEQLRIQIQMATIYCLARSNRGFAIMESLLPKLNELVAAGVKLDGFDTHYLRDGEWNMTGEGATGNLLTILAHNAGYFAWFDFDRAITLAAQFERPEIRMMAQLKLAQGILAGPPKRIPGSVTTFY